MKQNWHGILKILEIQHLNSDGKLLWEAKDLYNVLHYQGENLIIGCMFCGTTLPKNYYFGLDMRTSILQADTLASTNLYNTIIPEPHDSGYARQSTTSSGFTLSPASTSGGSQAMGPVVTFSATSGYTVYNLFLTDCQSGINGNLIATVTFPSAITINAGDVVNMRMSLTLSQCLC